MSSILYDTFAYVCGLTANVVTDNNYIVDSLPEIKRHSFTEMTYIVSSGALNSTLTNQPRSSLPAAITGIELLIIAKLLCGMFCRNLKFHEHVKKVLTIRGQRCYPRTVIKYHTN